jgi:hypothetical protein
MEIENYKKDFLLDQYKELTQFYKNESSLFYTRHNIFISIYFVAIGGILSKLNDLTIHPDIFRFFLYFILVISISNFLSTYRSFVFQNQLMKELRNIEALSENKLWLINKFYKIHSKSVWYQFSFFNKNANIQPRIFTFTSLILVIFWVGLIIYIENIII